MKYRDLLPGRQIVGRLEKGEDMLEAFTGLARSQQIRLAMITGIGALQKARISMYDQAKKNYNVMEINEETELTALVGNISLKDGDIFCHLHATLTDADGKAWGGHVCEGCIVFALEFEMRELLGEDFHRMPDEDTGLALWEI